MNDNYRIRIVKQTINEIESALKGRLDLLELCRSLCRMRTDLSIDGIDAMNSVRAVESELDDIPSRREYALWNAAKLQIKIAEKNEYLRQVESTLFEDLREIKEYLQERLKSC